MRSSRCVLQAWLAFSLASAPTFVRAQEAEPQAQDPMSAYRERFRMGLVRYQAGNVSEAIQFWEPVYRELGAARGWRLAFNLARAYELFGDATRAVERYESFLSQVAERRQRGEVIEELIQKEEDVARAKLAEMASTKGRIVVPAEGERASLASRLTWRRGSTPSCWSPARRANRGKCWRSPPGRPPWCAFPRRPPHPR